VDDSIENIKDISINGVLLGKYILEDQVVFLKVIKYSRCGIRTIESALVVIISESENVNIRAVGYLNI